MMMMMIIITKVYSLIAHIQISSKRFKFVTLNVYTFFTSFIIPIMEQPIRRKFNILTQSLIHTKRWHRVQIPYTPWMGLEPSTPEFGDKLLENAPQTTARNDEHLYKLAYYVSCSAFSDYNCNASICMPRMHKS